MSKLASVNLKTIVDLHGNIETWNLSFLFLSWHMKAPFTNHPIMMYIVHRELMHFLTISIEFVEHIVIHESKPVHPRTLSCTCHAVAFTMLMFCYALWCIVKKVYQNSGDNNAFGWVCWSIFWSSSSIRLRWGKKSLSLFGRKCSHYPHLSWD